jgi:hypothetical protein
MSHQKVCLSRGIRERFCKEKLTTLSVSNQTNFATAVAESTRKVQSFNESKHFQTLLLTKQMHGYSKNSMIF